MSLESPSQQPDPQAEQLRSNLTAAMGVLKKAKAAVIQIKESKKPPAKKAEAIKKINNILREQVLTPLEESRPFAAQNSEWKEGLEGLLESIQKRIDNNEAQAQEYEKENQQKDAVFHYNLGFSLYRQKKYPEAEAAYKEAVKLDPDEPFYRKNLKLVQEKLGKLLESASATIRIIEREILAAYGLTPKSGTGGVKLKIGEIPAPSVVNGKIEYNFNPVLTVAKARKYWNRPKEHAELAVEKFHDNLISRLSLIEGAELSLPEPKIEKTKIDDPDGKTYPALKATFDGKIIIAK